MGESVPLKGNNNRSDAPIVAANESAQIKRNYARGR